MINHYLYRRSRRMVYDLLQNQDYESPVSKSVDYFLIFLIIANVSAVIAESVDDWYYSYQPYFQGFEILSLVIFGIEYILRLWSIVEEPVYDANNNKTHVANWRKRLNWIKSPGAIIDFIAIAPGFVNFFVNVDLRFLRILRLFRLLKLTRYFAAMQVLMVVFQKEKESFKAVVFILLIMIVTASSGIYVVENQAQPEVFGSIPQAMWWAVVTLTTVGYGDVIPITPEGKVLGAVITILGVGLAALPAGILASGLASELESRRDELEQNFRKMLLDEKMDVAQNTRQVELIRRKIGLSKDQADDVIMDILREQELKARRDRLENRRFCSHCGERL